ncbi:MAG TPA: hypothetical protein VKK30_05985 [Actinomycetota bacterium]|nr:hypothetical protein [Actinomycetota bacterium]
MSAFAAPPPEEEWTGRYRNYDIVKEFFTALLVVTLLSVGLAVAFSSPDERPVTIAGWARADAKDFVAAAIMELNHTSEVAQYGPPYTHTPSAAQKVGPVDLQSIPGVRIPIDTAQAFVIQPLRSTTTTDPSLSAAIDQYTGASTSQQGAWTDAYSKALDKVTISAGTINVPAGDYGPVATMIQHLLSMAQGGGLDGALLTTKQFYQTDYTKPILFLSGGSHFEDRAGAEHLTGEQWGMMNETGNYPGQAWLWLYTFWYQISPFKNSGNADAEIWVIMMLLTLALALVPFIPGVRSIPKWVPIHRLIWRDYYRKVEHPNLEPPTRV